MSPTPPNGAQALVQALLAQGVTTAFGVPGESFLAVLDALHDQQAQLRFVSCRQEGGAAMMAEAWGKLTGTPGVCLVTRGPGAANALAGVHVAFQDSTPLLLCVGQVARGMREREAFQEIDIGRLFGSTAKWAAQIDDAARVPEFISRAFHVARSGRPGPVVLGLPEDMQHDPCPTPVLPAAPRLAATPSAPAMAELRDRLLAARRPVLLLGGRGWTAAACEDLRRFAEAWALPVACAFRYQDLVDNLHPQYAGDVGFGLNPALAARLREADLLLAVGPRLGEATTGGYTLFEVPRPRQTLVHVHAGAEELGRVYYPDLPILAGYPEFAAASAALVPPAMLPWAGQAAAAHADYQAWSMPPAVPAAAGHVDLGAVMGWLRTRLPEDAIVANGAGNYALWVHRFLRYRRFGTQLAPTSGSMGYGVPAAIAAQLLHPQRTVLAFAGDGCFLMHGQELATAVQTGARVRFIVVNNGQYGTIRMHQQRHYPGRPLGTALRNPDFAALARAYGAWGETVRDASDFPAAFERALAEPGPALIELLTDPARLTPATVA